MKDWHSGGYIPLWEIILITGLVLGFITAYMESMQ